MSFVDQIAQRLATREIAEGEALRRARSQSAIASLDAEEVERMIQVARQVGLERRLHHLIPLLKVLATAVDGAADRLPAELRDRVGIAFVEGVALALWEVADPRLYAEAITRGEAVVQHANARNDDLISAAASMALGVLHLDPYSAHRSLEVTAHTRAEWERRLGNGETWDGTIVLPEEGTPPYPAPEEAMRRAEQYLRAAAERRVEGAARARVLNALFAALDARHRLGDPPPEDVLLSTAREALQASAALKEPAAEVELLAKWQRTGQPIDRKFLSKALSVVPAEVMPQIGSVDTVSMLLMLAGILRKEGEGAEALQFLAKNESFFEVHAQGNARRQWLDEVLISLCVAYAPGFVLPALPVQDSFNEVQRMAEEQRWTAERFGAALLMLANHASRAGEGLFGLELLTIVEEVQTFLPYAPLSIRNLRKVLWWSAAQAANLSVDNKISYLGQALLDSAALGDAHIAGLILTDLLEPVAAAESAGLRSLADLLARLLLPLELLLGDKGSQQLQRVLGAALVRLVVTGGDRTTTHDLLRLAKGCRFSVMLASGAARRAHSPILLDEDPRVRTMRTRIDELLRDDPRAGLPPVRGERLDRLGELTLVTPQSREGISLSGNSTEEQLVNMQFRLDARLDELLTERTPWHHARDAKADALPGILGEQTVLLEQFLTSRGDAEFLVLFARTAGDSRLGAAQLGSATVSQTYAAAGVTVTLGETAVRVRALRNEINKEPEPGSTEMAETARAKLQNSKYLLGEMSEVLPVWYAEGKRHLCIMPHGPLHIAPTHLVPAPERPLARDWIVTYLPSLHLLTTRTQKKPRRKRRLTAIGVSFTGQNPFGLPVLENVEAEVRSVAATMRGAVIPDDKATERAIIKALQTSRYVHLATHGAHNHFAASSQSIFCAPGDGGDGRLSAHELLGLDLRGLDLVTMSACETALGRFDLGDNLRGLPAVLFLAGVRTIIGSLWDVETGCAETFFVAFYASLAASKDKLVAFAEAQRVTRERHPQYRDWGAFYFSGDWV